MAHNRIKPVTLDAKSHTHDSEVIHPAFGQVHVHRISSTGETLFESALNHQHFIRIRVSSAVLNRGHHHSWVYSSNMNNSTIVEFDLSESQWAHMVASAGNQGTPVTLVYARDGQTREIPGIEFEESTKDTFEREIKEQSAKLIKDLRDSVKELQTLADSGKIGKTALKEVLSKFSHHVENFAGNQAFTQSMFAETMEKTVEAGKSEIEAFANQVIHAKGLQALVASGEMPTLLTGPRKDDIQG